MFSVRDLGFVGRLLVSVGVFLVFGVFVVLIGDFDVYGYSLFLLFVPLVLTSCFFVGRWSVVPGFLATGFLFVISVLLYGQLFFDRLFISLLNLGIFFVIFVLVSVLIGRMNLYLSRLKRDKERVERRLNRYEVGVKASGDSVYMVDLDFCFVFANNAYLERLVGEDLISRVDEELVVGKSLFRLYPDSCSDLYKECVEEVFRSGRQVEREHRSIGGQWVANTYSPVENPVTEELMGVIVVSKDITDKKKARMREEYINSLFRHDVRNKTQISSGYLELIDTQDLPTEVKSYIEKARKGVKETLEIIEKVRSLTEVEKQEPEVIDLNQLLRRVVEKNKGRGMKINLDISEETMVLGGPLLNQVFSNLIENSIKHSNGSFINIDVRVLDEQVVCVIEDDGDGLPPKVRDKVFEKGYSWGEKKGTGNGLYLVKMVLESYGGKVKVKDSSYGGVRFDLYLKKP
ncbi:PAS domain-containing sensor histidine kinase [Methanonatronarchaeum sp. AMET-Sl]|uniref:sensor histidine kinase n=1 Tax=Methanonatronarchaeum sp. AMET-Sl TaxID=3037654 RepID=UPI00244D9EBB|nr:PAS domain-containing sensor histidine kinase [Methanonatronarchaeum sp. AMET-Sl]WGI18097.1 ATP-binding protein [Methanonatronarchaeum sp. AMET-Sl]